MRACLVASVVSGSLWCYGPQPTRLLCPWDSPGKNTSMCLLHWQGGSLPLAPPRLNTYSFLVCLLATYSCPTLCNPVNYSQPRSSVHGILQARIPEWVIFYFFMIPSWSVWVSRNLSIFFLSCPICWCIIVHSTLIILCIPMVLVVASLLSFIILCIQVHFSFSSVSLTKDLSILFICSKTNS